jgi:hypothetical protein
MNFTRDRVAALALLFLGCGAYWAATPYPIGSLAQPGPGFVPRLLAALLAAGAAALLLHGGAAARLREIDFSDVPITVVIVALLSAGAFALERAGYRPTLAGLLFLFLAVVERRPLWLSVLLAVGFALGSFYVINDVLLVPLPMSRWGW